MADTTARTLRLLELLQSSQLRTVAELADRFDVDDRTVRRDVARLGALGVPVETLRGRYGGYRLATGQRVLPIMFSSAEVVAVFLGLSREQAASSEPEIAAQTALAKIKRALPTADAKRIDTVLEAIAPSPESGGVSVDPGVMLSLADAVDRRAVLDLRYLDSAGIASRRTIHPYGVIAHSDKWYLLALDTDQQEERTFRVDRIRSVRSTSDTFAAPQKSDPKQRLVDRFVEADYRWQIVLHIRSSEDQIRSHLPASVARLERSQYARQRPQDSASAWHRAEIHAQSLDWLPAVIAALGCEVVIERPKELRSEVRAAARRLFASAEFRFDVNPRSE